MKSKAAKEIRELNRRYWKDLISILKEYDLREEDVSEFEELFPSFYPPFPPYKYYTKEIDQLQYNMKRFSNEFQEKSSMMLMDMFKLTGAIRNVGDKLFKIPLIGKLDLKEFLKVALRKFWELKIIWIILICTFLFLAFFFPTSSTNNNLLRSYFDNLYTILMAFTTIGFGDIHPVTFFSRFISVFLGVIGIATIGLLITIIWGAAIEASKE